MLKHLPRFLLLILFCGVQSTLIAQDRTITGTVTDSDSREGLPGVNILVKGTTTGTITNVEGEYRLDIPADASTLVFSSVGFASQEVTLGNQNQIDVQMLPDVQSLSEVVVIGYGTETKKNLTGSVGVVGAERLQARPITSASQSLQGQVSGVWINQNLGEPGDDGATIRIRGIGTLNNPDPLILVDGIEAPFNNIDPNDIESITVLKDAASAAIYGSRAANGVVLVTTKRGKLNAKPSISYNNYFGTQTPANIPDFIWDSQQFMELRNEADINSGRDPLYPQEVVDEYAQIGPNTNWFDEIFEPAFIQQHNLSISGGSQTTNFMLSVGYLDQNAVVKNTVGTERYNARMNLDSRITDNFTVGTSLAFSRQESILDNISQDGGILARATRLGPNFPAFDDQGRFADRDRTIDAIELSTPNILAEAFSLQRTLLDNRFLGNFYAEYEIIEGLKVRGTLAANYRVDDDQFFNRRADTYDWRTGDLALVWWENRRLEEQHTERLNITSWLQANYEKSFGSHNFKALVGLNQESFNERFFAAARQELPSNSLAVLNTGNPETASNEGSATAWALRSIFGRLGYNYDQKYLFEFNIRRDGSSRFGANNRWAVFPSFSGGWVVSQEPFMQNIPAIDFLKIRASWGQLGNQNLTTSDQPNDFPFASGISFEPAYSFGGAIVGAAAQTTLGNPDIRWETTTQTDIGINLGLFQSKLGIEADYFIKTTDDILFNQQNPGVTGVRTPTTRNIAEVENRGWEVALNYTDQFGDFSFDVGFNVTNVKNEVKQIDPNALADADRVIDGNYVTQRGSPINSLFGLQALGIFQSQDEIDNAPDQSLFAEPQPGDIRYADANGDGVVNIEDRVVIGKEIPTWIYGINLNLGYKGFDLTALLQGVGDMDAYEASRFYAPFQNSGGVASFWTGRWTPENPSTTLPRLVIPQTGVNYNVTHSLWITPRDYLRLKNLQIGYNLPRALLDNTFIESFRVFVNGQNLFTITDYVGFDPEREARNANGTAGYPQMRILSAGLNLRF